MLLRVVEVDYDSGGAIFLTTRYNTGVDLGPILSEKDLEEGKARWYQWVLMLGVLSRALQTKYSGGIGILLRTPPLDHYQVESTWIH